MAFDFGINKSKQTAVTTYTDNSNVAAQEDSIALGAGATYFVQALDGGAIEEAFGLGNRSVDLAGDSVKRSLNFALDYAGLAAKQTGDVLDSYAAQSRDSLSQLVQFSTEQNKSSVQQLTESIFTTGVYALVAMAGLLALYAYSQRNKAA